jgi:hypothetical protein
MAFELSRVKALRRMQRILANEEHEDEDLGYPLTPPPPCRQGVLFLSWSPQDRRGAGQDHPQGPQGSLILEACRRLFGSSFVKISSQLLPLQWSLPAALGPLQRFLANLGPLLLVADLGPLRSCVPGFLL